MCLKKFLMKNVLRVLWINIIFHGLAISVNNTVTVFISIIIEGETDNTQLIFKLIKLNSMLESDNYYEKN